MKKLCLVAVFLLSYFTFAQNASVKGIIVADSSAVNLGQITIFSLPDSTLRKGTYLDSTYFETLVETNSVEKFYAKIKVPGYTDTLIQFTVTDSVVNLGVIEMESDQSLETVDVVYRKQMFKRTMDGIQVNVEGTSLQNLTNLFEVLKASPKITSSDDQRIEIIGRGSPLILVDRQAIISNDELRAIPASQIETIEIITNPSAKYKAQGSGSGVIEVYTKNFHLEGYNASISTSGGINTQLRPTADLGVGMSVKKGKFSLNGYLGASYNAGNGFGTSYGFTTDDSNRQLNGRSDNESQNTWQYYNVKSAYNISEKQRLSFGVNGNGSNGEFEDRSTTEYLSNNILQTTSESASNSGYGRNSNSAFMNYTFETDTNHSALEVNLNYTNRRSKNDGEFINLYEDVVNGTNGEFKVRNDERDIPNVGEFRANYEHVFDTTGWTLEFGGSYNALFNEKRFDRFNLLNNEWVKDETFSNSYGYQEHIGALFAEVSKDWKKWGARLGVRGEYTRLDGFSNSLDQQFIDSSFIKPFPNASVMWQPKDMFAITASYKAGIDRPQFSSYDPFVRMEDSLNVEYGNPFLRPSVLHTFSLDFEIAYAYSLSIFYQRINDPTSEISFVSDNSFLTETTPFNSRSEDIYGGSINLPFKKDWIQGWNSIWVNYTVSTFRPEFGREPFSNLTYGLYSYLTFNLKAGFSIMNRVHLNKWGWDSQRNNVRTNWGIRVTKKFNGNNFQLFADVGNLIPPRNKSTVFSGNFEYQSDRQNQFTSFKVGLYWKFGRLKASTNIQESSSGQSDRL